MGEEWAAREPFPWFCDFEPRLAASVRQHRAREFPGSPDPGAAATCSAARLNWEVHREGAHARAFTFHRRLLAIRRRDIVPLIPQLSAGRCTHAHAGGAFAVEWTARDQVLRLIANLSAQPAPLAGRLAGRVIFATHPGIRATLARAQLAPWSVLWLLERRRERR
jgi:1,4-alpha-glucan branching enzyme